MGRRFAAGIMATALLALATPGAAQTDALVVAPSGDVGVGTAVVGPAEDVVIVASLRPPFAKSSRRCMQGVPVRVAVIDVANGEPVLSEEGTLSAETRSLTAIVPAAGGEGATLQIGVLTSKRLTRCVLWSSSAVGPGGVRQLGP